MARPKKPRFIDGIQLEDNLYKDPRGRANHFQYTRPDSSKLYFHTDSVHRANELAKKANNNRDNYRSTPKEMGGAKESYLQQRIHDYIRQRELETPSLQAKESWRNRCYHMHKFARETTTPPAKLNRDHIQSWWNSLTRDQQKARKAEFRRLFNYLMGHKLLPKMEYNPFTTNDDKPILYLFEKQQRKRERLDTVTFWRIYEKAGELNYQALQIAMGLAITTFLRENDILTLCFDENIENNQLRVLISKSAAQKGETKASRLRWDLDKNKVLASLIETARANSRKNQNCPFIISHRPKQKRKGATKEHFAQVTPRRLQGMFREARDATGIWDELPYGKTPPTFHEIRSLADAKASEAGYKIDLIQEAMAHSDKSQTLLYQANHNLPYEEVDIEFTEKMIGGKF